MSARYLVVLALVAYVTVQASSYPYGAKGGQSYYLQEPVKGSYSQQQWQQPSQQFAEPARQETILTQSTAPVVSAPAQLEAAPVKGQSFYQSEQRFEAPRAPVTTSVQVHESAPVKGAPVQGQSFYQSEQRFEAPAPAPVVSQTTQYTAPVTHYEAAPVKGQSFYQAEQRHEAAPLVAQSTAPAQVYESAPVKGQSFYQPAQRYETLSRAPFVSKAPAPVLQYEAAPVKGQSFYQPAQHYEAPRAPLAQSYYVQEPLKGQYYPQRQETVVAQQHQPLVSAPAQTTTVLAEPAPVKGQSFYQSEQRFEAPRAQSVVYESAPVQQVSSYKA